MKIDFFLFIFKNKQGNDIFLSNNISRKKGGKIIQNIIEFYPAIYDNIFKKVMLNPNNIKYLKYLINFITKILYNNLNNLIAINNEILVNKK